MAQCALLNKDLQLEFLYLMYMWVCDRIASQVYKLKDELKSQESRKVKTRA